MEYHFLIVLNELWRYYEVESQKKLKVMFFKGEMSVEMTTWSSLKSIGLLCL